MLHVADSMCRQFLSQGGVQVLCDLLVMQGLPFDFPVSAACASVCKIFEQLVSYLPINEVLSPLLQVTPYIYSLHIFHFHAFSLLQTKTHSCLKHPFLCSVVIKNVCSCARARVCIIPLNFWWQLSFPNML